MKKLGEIGESGFATFALLVLISIPVLLLSMPTLPTVMQDEYVYSIGARYDSDYGESFGNLVFMAIYGITGFFGENFYFGAKLLNLVFQTIGALGVFFLAKLYFGRRISLVFGIAYFLGPNLLYTSTFMPDVLHGAIVVWLLYLALRIPRRSRFMVSWIILMGFVSALGLLIKFHSVAAILGIFVLIGLQSLWQSFTITEKILRPTAYFFSTYIFWVLIAWSLSGHLIVLPFGRNYMGSLYSETGISAPLLMTVGFVGAAIFILVTSILSHSSNLPRNEDKNTDLFALMLIVSATYALLIVSFTIFITISGDDHSQRLLFRHFEFLIPLIVLATAVAFVSSDSGKWKQIYGFLVLLIWITAFAGAFGLALFTDSAFVYSLDRGGLFVVLISTASIGLFVYLGFTSRNFSRNGFFHYLVLIALVAPSIVGLFERASNASEEVTADIAGRQASSLSVEHGAERVVVVSTNLQSAFLAMMWVDDPSSEYKSDLQFKDLEKLTDDQNSLVLILDPAEGIGGDVQEDGYSIFLPSK